MATSLSAQLNRLRQRPAHLDDAVKGPKGLPSRNVPSLLFAQADARNITREQVHEIALHGLRALTALDNRLAPFAVTLFDAALVRRERGMLTSEESAALSDAIAEFLVFLGPHLMLPAALQVLEYLVRVFEAHTYDATSLLLCALPAHDQGLFTRILSLLDLRGTGFEFLSKNQTDGAPLARGSLLTAALENPKVLRHVCEVSTRALKHKVRHPAAFALTMSVCAAIADKEGSEPCFRILLPYLVDWLAAPAAVAAATRAGATAVEPEVAAAVAADVAAAASLILMAWCAAARFAAATIHALQLALSALLRFKMSDAATATLSPTAVDCARVLGHVMNTQRDAFLDAAAPMLLTRFCTGIIAAGDAWTVDAPSVQSVVRALGAVSPFGLHAVLGHALTQALAQRTPAESASAANILRIAVTVAPLQYAQVEHIVRTLAESVLRVGGGAAAGLTPALHSFVEDILRRLQLAAPQMYDRALVGVIERATDPSQAANAAEYEVLSKAVLAFVARYCSGAKYDLVDIAGVVNAAADGDGKSAVKACGALPLVSCVMHNLPAVRLLAFGQIEKAANGARLLLEVAPLMTHAVHLETIPGCQLALLRACAAQLPPLLKSANSAEVKTAAALLDSLWQALLIARIPTRADHPAVAFATTAEAASATVHRQTGRLIMPQSTPLFLKLLSAWNQLLTHTEIADNADVALKRALLQDMIHGAAGADTEAADGDVPAPSTPPMQVALESTCSGSVDLTAAVKAFAAYCQRVVPASDVSAAVSVSAAALRDAAATLTAGTGREPTAAIGVRLDAAARVAIAVQRLVSVHITSATTSENADAASCKAVEAAVVSILSFNPRARLNRKERQIGSGGDAAAVWAPELQLQAKVIRAAAQIATADVSSGSAAEEAALSACRWLVLHDSKTAVAVAGVQADSDKAPATTAAFGVVLKAVGKETSIVSWVQLLHRMLRAVEGLAPDVRLEALIAAFQAIAAAVLPAAAKKKAGADATAVAVAPLLAAAAFESIATVARDGASDLAEAITTAQRTAIETNLVRCAPLMRRITEQAQNAIVTGGTTGSTLNMTQLNALVECVAVLHPFAIQCRSVLGAAQPPACPCRLSANAVVAAITAAFAAAPSIGAATVKFITETCAPAVASGTCLADAFWSADALQLLAAHSRSSSVVAMAAGAAVAQAADAAPSATSKPAACEALVAAVDAFVGAGFQDDAATGARFVVCQTVLPSIAVAVSLVEDSMASRAKAIKTRWAAALVALVRDGSESAAPALAASPALLDAIVATLATFGANPGVAATDAAVALRVAFAPDAIDAALAAYETEGAAADAAEVKAFATAFVAAAEGAVTQSLRIAAATVAAAADQTQDGSVVELTDRAVAEVSQMLRTATAAVHALAMTSALRKGGAHGALLRLLVAPAENAVAQWAPFLLADSPTVVTAAVDLVAAAASVRRLHGIAAEAFALLASTVSRVLGGETATAADGAATTAEALRPHADVAATLRRLLLSLLPLLSEGAASADAADANVEDDDEESDGPMIFTRSGGAQKVKGKALKRGKRSMAERAADLAKVVAARAAATKAAVEEVEAAAARSRMALHLPLIALFLRLRPHSGSRALRFHGVNQVLADLLAAFPASDQLRCVTAVLRFTGRIARGVDPLPVEAEAHPHAAPIIASLSSVVWSEAAGPLLSLLQDVTADDRFIEAFVAHNLALAPAASGATVVSVDEKGNLTKERHRIERVETVEIPGCGRVPAVLLPFFDGIVAAATVFVVTQRDEAASLHGLSSDILATLLAMVDERTFVTAVGAIAGATPSFLRSLLETGAAAAEAEVSADEVQSLCSALRRVGLETLWDRLALSTTVGAASARYSSRRERIARGAAAVLSVDAAEPTHRTLTSLMGRLVAVFSVPKAAKALAGAASAVTASDASHLKRQRDNANGATEEEEEPAAAVGSAELRSRMYSVPAPNAIDVQWVAMCAEEAARAFGSGRQHLGASLTLIRSLSRVGLDTLTLRGGVVPSLRVYSGIAHGALQPFTNAASTEDDAEELSRHLLDGEEGLQVVDSAFGALVASLLSAVAVVAQSAGASAVAPLAPDVLNFLVTALRYATHPVLAAQVARDEPTVAGGNAMAPSRADMLRTIRICALRAIVAVLPVTWTMLEPLLPALLSHATSLSLAEGDPAAGALVRDLLGNLDTLLEPRVLLPCIARALQVSSPRSHSFTLLFQVAQNLIGRLDKNDIRSMERLGDGTIFTSAFEQFALQRYLPSVDTLRAAFGAYATMLVKFKESTCVEMLSRVVVWASTTRPSDTGLGDAAGAKKQGALKRRRLDSAAARGAADSDESDDDAAAGKKRATRTDVQRWSIVLAMFDYLVERLGSVSEFIFPLVSPLLVDVLSTLCAGEAAATAPSVRPIRGAVSVCVCSALALTRRIADVANEKAETSNTFTDAANEPEELKPYFARNGVFDAVSGPLSRQLGNTAFLPDGASATYALRLTQLVLPTLRSTFRCLRSPDLWSRMQQLLLQGCRHPEVAVRVATLTLFRGIYQDGGDALASLVLAEALPTFVEATEDEAAPVAEEARQLCNDLSTLTGQEVLHFMTSA